MARLSVSPCTGGVKISSRHDQLIRQTVVITHAHTLTRVGLPAAAAVPADWIETVMRLEMHEM